MLRILLLLLSICIASCVRAQIHVPTDSVPGILEETYRLIRAHHPFCYDAAGREAMDRARTQVQSQLEQPGMPDSLSLSRVLELLSPLQRVTGDGHLLLRPRLDSLARQRVYSNRFHLSLALLGEATYVLREPLAVGGDTLPRGTVVTAINGEEIDAVIHGISTFQGLNDHGADRAPRVTYARFPSSQYQKFYGHQDSLRLSVTGVDGPREVIIRPEYSPYTDAVRDSVNLADMLTLELLEEGRVAHLQIRSFTNKPYRDGNYFQFIRETFDRLREAGTEKLIIDLRGNTGGNSSKIIYLFKRLAERPFYFARQAYPSAEGSKPGRRQRKISRQLTSRHKPAKRKEQLFSGRVIVLIDEVSYSASGMFARMVQGSGRGVLIGSPGGAAAGVVYSGSGRFKPFPVGPDDVLELLINDIKLVQDFAVPGTVVPDILVPVTLEDLRLGVDAALARAIAE